MDTDTAPVTTPAEPTQEQIAKATQEYADATDRMAVIQKYPFLKKTIPDFNRK